MLPDHREYRVLLVRGDLLVLEALPDRRDLQGLRDRPVRREPPGRRALPGQMGSPERPVRLDPKVLPDPKVLRGLLAQPVLRGPRVRVVRLELTESRARPVLMGRLAPMESREQLDLKVLPDPLARVVPRALMV